jgi:hypothetical protein
MGMGGKWEWGENNGSRRPTTPTARTGAPASIIFPPFPSIESVLWWTVSGGGVSEWRRRQYEEEEEVSGGGGGEWRRRK